MEADIEKIRTIRTTMGLTTQDLAERIKPRPVTRQCVEQWERKGIKTFRVLQRIADALGVRPELLLKKGG